MNKENSYHELTGGFDLSDSFSEVENHYISVHFLWTWKISENDAPKFRKLLLQSLGISNYFETSVSTNRNSKFLFPLIL